jgi:hypothetical protein
VTLPSPGRATLVDDVPEHRERAAWQAFLADAGELARGEEGEAT